MDERQEESHKLNHDCPARCILFRVGRLVYERKPRSIPSEVLGTAMRLRTSCISKALDS